MNLKTGVTRKQSKSNFPKNEHFLPHDTHLHVCVSGGKKCSFCGKFDVLCFLVTAVGRFALLPYYRWYVVFQHNWLDSRYLDIITFKREIQGKSILTKIIKYYWVLSKWKIGSIPSRPGYKHLQYKYCSKSHELKTTRQWNLVN